MKIHAKPTTTLVAAPRIVPEGIGQVLEGYGQGTMWNAPTGGPGDRLAEFMGRLCYGSFGKRQGRIGAMEYLGNVMGQGHGSVLEHANWSFVIEGATRGLTHQMVRHRAGFAFSQESTHFIRYSAIDEQGSTEAEISLCGILADQQHAFMMGCVDAIQTYEKVWREMEEELRRTDSFKKKVVSGAARGLLPTALCSRLGFTANGRALRHFCALRGAFDNTLEIRYVAAQVTAIMLAEAPALFQDFVIADGIDGYPIVDCNWRKV